jgi:hypothetical protein
MGNAYLIAWDNAAPERNVCPALITRRTTFGRKVLHLGRWWDRVERHVHDCSYAPRRSRTSARPKTLPIRPPRLVEVHMRTGHTHEQGWELTVTWGAQDKSVMRRLHLLDESRK